MSTAIGAAAKSSRRLVSGAQEQQAESGLLPLCIRNLVYKVQGKALVDGISLEICTPGVTAIMGPNGAGKSVLLRLLHGLLTPTSGTIWWNGVPATVHTRRRQSLVFQRPVLLRRTVRANLLFALRLRGPDQTRSAALLLDRVGLKGKADVPARRLSGGEQQRLALARALAVEPDVLFLDEPTASLDPSAASAIESIVLGARAGGTKLIFVTHDAGQARRLADDVVFLNRGKIEEYTPATQFFRSPASVAASDYLAGRLVI